MKRSSTASDPSRTSPPRAGSTGLVVLFSIAAPNLGNQFRQHVTLQDFFATPVGVALLGAFCGAYAWVLVRWAADRPARRRFLAAVAAGTGLIAVEIVIIHIHGWLGGTVVHAPLFVQLLVYTPHVFVLALVPLAIHRSLARRRPRLALVVYLGVVAAFAAASVPAERYFLARGIMTFRNGYAMREDILWGVLMHLSTLTVYLGTAPRSA